MKNWWPIALDVIFGLLGSGAIFVASNPPRGTAIDLLPLSTLVPIQVHVTGAIQHPRVYALPIESRVQDAIQSAGGFKSIEELISIDQRNG